MPFTVYKINANIFGKGCSPLTLLYLENDFDNCNVDW